ncbi:MAG TPA: hypothetical protein PLS95_20180 [Thermoanaerobaculales bacterium]|nr:hypothetical protein [Thermoanaerobaculales bacterium]
MSLSKRDREFRLPKISYLDFKQLEMDRVLTAFFARLAHNGFPSRLRRKVELSVESFVEEFLEHPEWFTGFKDHRKVLERWVETHLLDIVNRKKANQAVAAEGPEALSNAADGYWRDLGKRYPWLAGGDSGRTGRRATSIFRDGKWWKRVGGKWVPELRATEGANQDKGANQDGANQD